MPNPDFGTLSASAADYYNLALEKVSPKVPLYIEESSALWKLIKPSTSLEIVSDRFYRQPFQAYRGGVWQRYNADGGALGRGSGPKYNHMMAAFVYTNYAISFTDRAKEGSEKAGQSVYNVVARQIADVMTEIPVYQDIELHGDGSGRLTNASTATGTWGTLSYTTYTFASPTDMLKVNMLRPGMAVIVYGTTTAVKANGTRAGYPYIIEDIDYDTGVVYLNAAVGGTGAAIGDFLAFVGEGADGTLTNIQTGTAGTTFGAYGTGSLNTDAWRHGLKYVNNTTGYFQTVNRATTPQLIPTFIGANGAYVHAYALQIRDQLLKRRGEEVVKNLVALAGMAQRAQIFSIGITVSEWQRSLNDKMIDLMPANLGYEDVFMVAGIPHHISKRQNLDRIDFFDPKTWFRTGFFEPQFRKNGSSFLWEDRNTNGLVMTSWHAFLTMCYDWGSLDPGAGAYITGLTVPSGYN